MAIPATYLFLTSYGGSGSGGDSNTAVAVSDYVNTSTATGVGASGTFGAVASVTLVPGRYILTAAFGINDNGAPLTDAVEATITDSATGAGAVVSTTAKVTSIGVATGSVYAVPSRILTVASTTDYYLNTKMTYASGSPQHYGFLSAEPI